MKVDIFRGTCDRCLRTRPVWPHVHADGSGEFLCECCRPDDGPTAGAFDCLFHPAVPFDGLPPYPTPGDGLRVPDPSPLLATVAAVAIGACLVFLAGVAGYAVSLLVR